MSQTLLALTQGDFAFGGYRFPKAFMVMDRQHNVIMEQVDLPFNPGGFAAASKPGPKTFSVVGVFGGGGANLDANGTPMTTADGVQAEVDRLMPLCYQGDQPFQYRPDRYVLAQAQRPKLTYATANGYRTVALTMDFVANDPREYSYAAKSQTTSGTIVWTNAGSFRAYPTIVLTLTGNGSIFFTPPLQGGSVGFNFTGSAGDVLTVVTDPRIRSITKNGSNAWSQLTLPVTNTVTPANTEILPYLDPGNTSITVTGASALIMCNDVFI